MLYLALLRGINVGGNNKVEMSKLKEVFEQLGLTDVKTYINSGNVIFRAEDESRSELTRRIENSIRKSFGIDIKVLLRDLTEIKKLVNDLPDKWINDDKMKCDVMFLWDEVDKPDIIKKIPYDPELEDLIYLPGAVVWRIDRDKASKSKVFKIVGTDLHKLLTVRNPNTVRKLYGLMVGV